MTATIAHAVTQGTSTLHPIAVKMRQIMTELSQQFQERDELIEVATIGLLTNEHTFILGPPGTGKSFFCRSFYGRIIGARYFEKAMAGDTPFEALAGAIDLVKLTTESKFERNIDGTLLTADFGMIDELGRMNGIVGDNLLPIILERVYHEVQAGGGSVIHIPLRSLMGGSNSLPTEENESAAALYDRFVLRIVVKPIHDLAAFITMLETGAVPVPNPTTLTLAEVAEAADVLVPAIRIPRDVLTSVAELRKQLNAKEIFPSDRRFNQCMPLIRASAFLNGRIEATTEDMAVLRFALWDDPAHQHEVARLTTSVSNPLGDLLNKLSDRLDEVEREYRKLAKDTGMPLQDKAKQCVILQGNCNVLGGDIDSGLQTAKQNGYSTARLDELTTKLAHTKQSILDMMLNSMASA